MDAESGVVVRGDSERLLGGREHGMSEGVERSSSEESESVRDAVEAVMTDESLSGGGHTGVDDGLEGGEAGGSSGGMT